MPTAVNEMGGHRLYAGWNRLPGQIVQTPVVAFNYTPALRIASFESLANRF